jgi:diguanylate cyclase (GGDEF)-like protein/PAS domain S-box-containing protein
VSRVIFPHGPATGLVSAPDDVDQFVWETEPMTMLGAVAAAANASTSTRAALARAIEQVVKHTKWAVGHAYEVDRADEARVVPTDLWALYEPGDGRIRAFINASNERGFVAGTGLPGRVLDTGIPAWIEDVTTDSNFPRATAALAADLHAAFAFPVGTSTRLVAVLEFFSHHAVHPDERFLKVIAQIGHQLGLVYEREQAKEELERSDARTRQILNTAGDAFVGMNTSGQVTEWNEQAEEIFGWTRDEALGRNVSKLIIPEDSREAHAEGLARFLATGEAHIIGRRLELMALRKTGAPFPIEITLWARPEQDSWIFYAFARDITERKEAEADLSRRASRDDLTGLLNRGAILECLRLALEDPEEDQLTALLFLDLDRFKLVNNSLGQEVGDNLLLAITERLRNSVRPTDTVGRLAGDEFLVVCRHVINVAAAEAVAKRIRWALTEPVQLNGETVRITASIGVAVANPRSDPEDLIRNADAAMFEAKSNGRGQLQVYNDKMRQGTLTRLRLEHDLETALTDGQLLLHYQPMLSLATGEMQGVEALLRWDHPEHGLLPPDRFVPVAEDSGLIVPIGAWVLEEACRQARAWRDQGLPPLKMSVNLSGRQLVQSDIEQTVANALNAEGFEGTGIRLCLEITESLLMTDPEGAAAILQQLRNVGVGLAIDDFGTGYSSLAYLKWFPVDTVKIDRSFVTGIVTEHADAAIVEAVINLSHALGFSVVAEGVENAAQCAKLVELGCDSAQGYLFSRPQPPALIAESLWEGAVRSWVPAI